MEKSKKSRQIGENGLSYKIICKSGKRRRTNVSGRVSVPCSDFTPVANAPSRNSVQVKFGIKVIKMA